MKKIVLMLICIALTGSLLFAGAKRESSSQENGYRSEINIAITAQPPTLDSAVTVSQVALDVANNIFEPLYALDANYAPQPVLAKSVEISPDGRTYTFPLREGVRFHNGKEMIAEDVVASMNRWLAISSRAKTLLQGASFSAVDKYTVKLSLAESASDVLIIIATWAQFPSIMPKELVETAAPEGVREYVGTGPYRFGEWRQDQYIRLDRYDGYQTRTETPSGFTGRKDAPTEHLYYRIVIDSSTRVAGIKTGEYDIAASIPTESYDELTTARNVKLYMSGSGVLTAFFNTRQGVLADQQIRQAILAAFNDEEILQASFGNPALYMLDPGYLNPAQVQWKTNAGTSYYNQKNPDKAKQLLAAAGYKGETVTILATPDYAEMYAASLVIQEELRQIGVNVKMVTYDFPTWLSTKSDLSTWDIFVASIGYQLTPPQILPVNPDWAGLNHERMAAGVKAIRAATNAEQSKTEWGALQEFMYEYAIGTPIGHYQAVVASTSKIEGYEQFLCTIAWNARIPK